MAEAIKGHVVTEDGIRYWRHAGRSTPMLLQCDDALNYETLGRVVNAARGHRTPKARKLALDALQLRYQIWRARTLDDEE